MNKKLVYLLTLLVSATLFLTSCGDDDPCKEVDCGANGTCFDGACVCDPGYEGSDCLTEWSAKFVSGTYIGKSTCLDASEQYQGSITRKSGTEIRINEFGGYTGQNHIDATVKLADASAESALAIEIVNFNDGFNRVFNGTGVLANRVLTITYTVDYNDGGPVENCVETLTLN